MDRQQAIDYARALERLDLNHNTAKLITNFWNEQMKTRFGDSEFLIEIHKILGSKIVESLLYSKGD